MLPLSVSGNLFAGRTKGTYAVTNNKGIDWLPKLPASSIQEGSRGQLLTCFHALFTGSLLRLRLLPPLLDCQRLPLLRHDALQKDVQQVLSILLLPPLRRNWSTLDACIGSRRHLHVSCPGRPFTQPCNTSWPQRCDRLCTCWTARQLMKHVSGTTRCKQAVVLEGIWHGSSADGLGPPPAQSP